MRDRRSLHKQPYTVLVQYEYDCQPLVLVSVGSERVAPLARALKRARATRRAYIPERVASIAAQHLSYLPSSPLALASLTTPLVSRACETGRSAQVKGIFTSGERERKRAPAATGVVLPVGTLRVARVEHQWDYATVIDLIAEKYV